jgi:hypothetical protein
MAILNPPFQYFPCFQRKTPKHSTYIHQNFAKSTTEKKDAAIRREKVLCCWWEIFTEIANLGTG